MKPTSLLLLSFFILSSLAQLPVDDEVDTSIPGYPHTIYSGKTFLIQDFWTYQFSPLKRIFIMCILKVKAIQQKIQSLFGSQEDLAVQE